MIRYDCLKHRWVSSGSFCMVATVKAETNSRSVTVIPVELYQVTHSQFSWLAHNSQGSASRGERWGFGFNWSNNLPNYISYISQLFYGGNLFTGTTSIPMVSSVWIQHTRQLWSKRLPSRDSYSWISPGTRVLLAASMSASPCPMIRSVFVVDTLP